MGDALTLCENCGHQAVMHPLPRPGQSNICSGEHGTGCPSRCRKFVPPTPSKEPKDD